MDAVRTGLVNLLLQVCQKHAGSLTPHLSVLIHTCLYTVRAEKLGRIKEKAMDLLGFCLMLVHAHQLDLSAQAEFTPPRDIIGQMFREINVSKSKLTQSMRGTLLATLGLLSELFPEEFSRQPQQARELADMYGRALMDEMEASKEPNRKVSLAASQTSWEDDYLLRGWLRARSSADLPLLLVSGDRGLPDRFEALSDV